MFGGPLSDQDAMLLFYLLHLFEIEVYAGVLDDNITKNVAAITQRHAAKVLASLYRTQAKDDPRADPHHWYYEWNGNWGSYSHEERFTQEQVDRLAVMKKQIESHPWVRAIREEE